MVRDDRVKITVRKSSGQIEQGCIEFAKKFRIFKELRVICREKKQRMKVE